MFNINTKAIFDYRVRLFFDKVMSAADEVVEEEIEKAAEAIKQKAKARMKQTAMNIACELFDNVRADFGGKEVTFTVKEQS